MNSIFRYVPPEKTQAVNSLRMSQHRRDGSVPDRPTSLKKLARKFLAYRAAQREALEPVDLFCRRGDHNTRFAYFD